MENRIIKLFLRLAISITFLSAIADRLGYWPKEISAWGHWDSFLEYTKLINPLVSESIIPALGLIVTVIEIIFAIGLLIGFKTELIAKLSGALLLLFALAMS
ncbi:MAG: DoxX family protein [Algibacter sp.]